MSDLQQRAQRFERFAVRYQVHGLWVEWLA